VSAAGPLTVTFTSSSPAVGEIATSTTSGASGTVVIPAGGANTPVTVDTGGVAFDPILEGNTVVRAEAPGFDATFPLSSVSVDVTQPGVTVTFSSLQDQQLGVGLQAAYLVTLDSSAHGGATVRVTSLDPSRARVAADASTPGTSFIDLVFSDGETSKSFFVQAVSGAPGLVDIVASEPRFETGTMSLEVVQPVLFLSGFDPTQTTSSPNDDIYAHTGIHSPFFGGSFWNQTVSAAGPLTVTFTSSNPAVGEIVTSTTSGASGTAVIPAAGGNTPFTVDTGGVAFDPIAEGATSVSATAPGFDAAFPFSTVAVTVTP
jgi:hypothetical protein